MTHSNVEILFYEETPLGILCLRRRALLSEPGKTITEITLNHEFLMSSYNTASERALANHALRMHQGKGLSVLVGGLGLGYTAHEALQSEKVASVEVIELLPQVIGWLDNDMLPLSKDLKKDVRLTVLHADIYKKLLNASERKYDIILIDVDHSPHEQLSGDNHLFYTIEGLKRAKSHLVPHGILGVWSYAQSSPFEKALRKVFTEVSVKTVGFKNTLLNEEHEDWLFFAQG